MENQAIVPVSDDIKVVTTTTLTEDTGAVAEIAKPEYIRLKIITSSRDNEIVFRVKKDGLLGRLKRSYCRKFELNVDEMRFVYDGIRITDEDTPRSMNMMEDDVIEIYHIRTGGGIIKNM